MEYQLNTNYPILAESETWFKDLIDIPTAIKINDNLPSLLNLTQPEIQVQQTILKAIIQKAEAHQLTHYTFAQKNRRTRDYEGFDHGRIFGPSSLQSCKRIIRHSIVRKDCIDIDMVNAHPVLLLHVCKILNISAPTLNQYVENREILLEELMKEYKLTRDKAKEILLCIINSGTRSKKYRLKWISDLEKETETIYDRLLEELIGKRILAHVKRVNKRDEKGI